MCGIAGYLQVKSGEPGNDDKLVSMLSVLTHRGPETAAIYSDSHTGLGHTRLSIVDLSGGLQPLANEDKTVWVVCNGEFYNHRELRQSLIAKGHTFRTHSDTEVLVHLYEEKGQTAISELNGEFAFALWDVRRQRLILARDRFGARPLFFTLHRGCMVFASEIKALFAYGVHRAISPQACREVLTIWASLPGRTMFDGVSEVLPGHFAVWQPGSYEPTMLPYWRLSIGQDVEAHNTDAPDYKEQVRQALQESVKRRLQADVPVSAYLSGGLDSTLIASLAQQSLDRPLQTFSVRFVDTEFDESAFSSLAADFIGTDHHILECDSGMIREALPEVIWHAETMLLRLGPVPMFMLSELVHRHEFKVVLTGEGADEIFAGYDIFKEMLIRRLWAKVPDSKIRPLALKRIYSHIPALQEVPPLVVADSFSHRLLDTKSPLYSHLVRWDNTSRLISYLSPGIRDASASHDVLLEIENRLPQDFEHWPALEQAQYLEINTFLSTYLLSSQGDRMMMSHGVEGRYPYLDHEVAELAFRLPRHWKIRTLKEEKYALRQAASGLVPEEILNRPKHPYRAPIRSVFAGQPLPPYAEDLLSDFRVRQFGTFDPIMAAAITKKVQRSSRLGEFDQMVYTGLLTYQLLHQMFISDWPQEFARRRCRPHVVRVNGNDNGNDSVIDNQPS